MPRKSPEPLVGLLVDPGPEAVIGVLGVLRAGCALVPISPSYPDERIHFILAECEIEVLVTAALHLPRARQLAAGAAGLKSIVCLDDLPLDAGAERGEALLFGRRQWQNGEQPADGRGVEADRLAYVIYTSGSTGQPKGVPIAHHNLVPLLLWSRDYFGLGEHTTALSTLSLSFDFGLFEVLSTLLFGGELHLVDGGGFADPALYGRFLRERPINTLHGTPSFVREIAAAAELGKLSLLHLGGEALARPQVDRLFQALAPQCVIHNGYGPTEASVNSTIFEVGSQLERRDLAGVNTPIGRASANNRAYVVDGGGGLAPIGVEGELMIGGPGLARGYWKRPRLTAELFVPDPWSAAPGGRLYRTGDRVRYRPDLNLEFLGRRDHQVKLRGFRLELGEIESVLAQHPEVAECAVVVRDDGAGEARLVAYLTSSSAPPPSAEELREFLREQLPPYMIPAAWVPLAGFPKTASGKLDRGALPAPAAEAAEGERFAPPATATEEVIAGVWHEVLGEERIGRDSNFFDLGGHSLLATQVISRLRKAFGIELAIAALFQAPTVRGLGARIDRHLADRDQAALPPLVRVPRDGALPLSFAQERLWFLHQLAPESTAYNVPRVARFAGPFDVRALSRTLAEIVRRHEIMRTTYRMVDGEARQVVAAPAPVPVPVVDLSGLGAAAADAETPLAHREARRPFDLARGPILRARLLRRGEEQHALLLSLHHVAWDGWSFALFSREMRTLYAAFTRDLPSPLADLPVQYADYASWQRGWMGGEVLATELAYWRRQLLGSPALLELPTDRPRPAVQRFAGAVRAFRWPRPLLDELRKLGRRHDATLFMVLLAGFELLLSRYSGQRDICVGSPIASRSRAELESLIGFFVNTLVLRVDLAAGQTVAELLGRVRQVALGAYAHQDVPFEQVVGELQPERRLSHSPLFQVMLALQNVDVEALELGALEGSSEVAGTGGAVADLTLMVAETPEGLSGLLEYDTDLFDSSTVDRLLDHLRFLYQQAAAGPQSRLAHLHLLSPAEQRQLALAGNDTAVAYRRDAGLWQLFREQVEERPLATAVEQGGERWTYEELALAAAGVASKLAERGVGRGDLVGLYLERGAALVAAMLGVSKAGAAYVPLDPEQPSERLDYLLDDAGILVVVARAEARAGLEARGREVVEAKQAMATEAGAHDLAACPAGGGDLAYLIYTSGSTGRPKGVGVPQRAVVRLVQGADYLAVEPGDRIAHASTPTFDAATFEIWGALLNGATLVPLEREALLAPARLESELAERRVDSLFLTTALFNQTVHERPTAFASLRELLFGGEAVDVGAVRRLQAAGAAPRRLLHVYGPTETTTFATWHPVDALPASATTVAIGGPIANTTAYVVGPDLDLRPAGIPGELWLGGDGLAQGYWRRPGATAERFVPHPWGFGERLYRSGDLVRQRPEGDLEFVGRLDRQVKVRGFRVEPGEIEAALLRHPEVEQAAVALHEDPVAGKQLVAYLVPADGNPPSVRTLREALGAWLPDFMVPSRFVTLAEMPLTASGKVDRQRLPAPAAEPEPGDEHAAPRTPEEHRIAALWGELLGRREIGVDDDFFELGGHSLLATRAMARLNETLPRPLPLSALFECPTVAELARRVADEAGAGEPQRPPLTRRPAADEVPLSWAQQRLWFLHQLEPALAVYNIPLVLRLEGELSVAALAASLQAILDRHEVLRAYFPESDGQARQRIAADAVLPLPVLDLARLAGGDGELARLAEREALLPFDLATAPQARARLLRVEPKLHLLLLTLHHIAADGWSMGVLSRELSAHYEGFARSLPPPLPPLPVQYGDYAAWQREWLRDEALAAELRHWQETLRGAPGLLDLPLDRPRPAVASFRGGLAALSLPPAVGGPLRQLCRAESATPFMAFLAIFQGLLGRYSGQHDFCVGTPIANRGRAEVQDLIGFFVNTLVLRARLDGAPTLSGLVRRVRETVLTAFDHQEVPFERVVDALQPERALGRNPLFQVSFMLQPEPLTPTAVGGLRMAPADLGGAVLAKFELTLALVEREGGWLAAAEYNADLFDPATIDRLLGHFASLAAAVFAEPDTRLPRWPLLSAGERDELLVERSGERGDFERDATVFEIFASIAAARPDTVALVGDGEQISYRRLYDLALATAAGLCEAGADLDAPVGLLCHRSPWMVVGMLGTLAAGGSYLPLDPSYPADRLALMAEDSRLRLILAEPALAAGLPPELPAGLEVLPLAPVPEAPAEEWDWRERQAGGSSLGCVIYTSGSTGRPKGVAVPQRGMLRLVRGTDFIRLDAEQVVLQLAPMSFDVANLELWGALLQGGRLVVAPPGVLELAELAELLLAQRISVLILTPPLFPQMVEAQLEALAEVPQVVTGADVVSAVHARRALEGGVERLINGYGPTENATATCCFAMDRWEPQWTTVPIGRPIRNTTVFVLDASLEPVPIGVPGELLTGGDGLARGYLHRRGLTAERFVPHPWEAGERLYRTGDRVRWLPQGGLEFLGRVDRQVKVRGFRIELGEVEAVLGDYPEVAAAVVVLREVEGDGKRLVAYVQPQPGSRLQEAELRSFLQAIVPRYMVPSHFRIVADFPLTSSGKIDRRALAARSVEEQGSGSLYVAPTSEVEKRLVAIWSEVLHVERVGVEDNFFEIGGDSILSLQVVSRANQAGLAMNKKQIFEAQTIAALARQIEASTVALPSAEQGMIDGEVPLTPVQRWFFELGLARPEHFNQTLSLAPRRPLQRAPLERALAAVVAHHDALRLRFERRDGDWRQHHGDLDGAWKLGSIDLGELPEGARAQALAAALEREQAGLDLAHGPLLSATLVALAPGEPARLLLVVHHLLVDWVSWGILLADLESAYLAAESGTDIVLPAKTTSFLHWARQLEAAADSPVWSADAEHWRGERGGGPPLHRDFADGANSVASLEQVEVRLAPQATAALLGPAANAYRARPLDLVLTALVEGLAGAIGERRLTVALEGHGREDLFAGCDVSRTVGWFTSPYPVTFDLRRKPRPGDAIAATKDRLARIPNGGVGFGVLRYLASDEGQRRELGRLAPQVTFNFLGQVDRALGGLSLFVLDDQPSGPPRAAEDLRPYELEIVGAVTGGQLHLSFGYSRHLHRRETVADWAERTLGSLSRLIEHCLATAGRPTAADVADFGWAETDLEDILGEVDRRGRAASDAAKPAGGG